MFDDVADGTKVWLWLREVAVIPSRTCGLLDLPCFLCTFSAATGMRGCWYSTNVPLLAADLTICVGAFAIKREVTLLTEQCFVTAFDQ